MSPRLVAAIVGLSVGLHDAVAALNVVELHINAREGWRARSR